VNPPLERIALQLHDLLTLVRSGVVRPMWPDTLMKILAGFLRWDLTAALGYAVGAAAHPERAAIVDDIGTLTFAEVDERTSRLASGLRELGVGAGSTVAVLCRNHRGLPETLAACAKLGAHTVLLNTAGSATQVAAVVRAHQARVVVADAEFRPLLRRLPRGVRRLTALADAPTRATTLERLVESVPVSPLPVRPPRSRVVVLTSGTTGTPKGACRPEPSGPGPAAAVLSRIPLRAGEPIIVPAPLFHSWGLAALQLGLTLGSTLVLPRRFDPAETLRAMERHQCTAMFAVPVMLQRIMELPRAERARYDLSALRIVACSGSALHGPLATRFQCEFGPVLYNLYGSTECSWVSIATPTDLRAAPGTAGRPPRGTRLAILDQEGNPVPVGKVGQIFVANDMLFDGYTNGTGRPLRGGLMSTGDLGYLDSSGLLFVVGRDDDMVISGGENVYPHEVEELLAALPEVREVAVKGVPDEGFGQRLAAFVVPSNGVRLEAGRVKAHVRANLAKFSVPRDVVFVEGLPRNAAGKVLKDQLRTH
jgi:fatty-acyl-CoA synthase